MHIFLQCNIFLKFIFLKNKKIIVFFPDYATGIDPLFAVILQVLGCVLCGVEFRLRE